VAQGARQFQTGDIIVSISNGDTLWYDSAEFIASIYQVRVMFKGHGVQPLNQRLY